MREYRDNFDLDEKLLIIHTADRKAIYHTGFSNSKVHIIKDSSEYAKELICSEKDIKMGIEIFRKVASLQDTDPNSKTYGLWSYYLEESLAQMDAPDKNMADFNAKEMAEVLITKREYIDDETAEMMLESIRHASGAILRRDEGVQYTNIAFMDSYVTLCAGQLLNEKKFIEYGREKLRKSLAFIELNGSVFEYNSPCYSIISVNDIGNIIKYVKDAEALEIAIQLNDELWRMLAQHFDYNRMQLGGPQSRAYSDYLTQSVLACIMEACDGRVNYEKHLKNTSIQSLNSNAICPERYIPYFSGEKTVRSMQKIVMRGFNYPFFAFSQTATYHCEERFSLGTMNHEELWNQRRPFLSYISGRNQPYCFRVKFLHDGYDFSSAVLHCVQQGSRVLGNVNFSDNRGDTHIGLDLIKDATITAEDLSLVFEIQGDTGDMQWQETDGKMMLSVFGTPVRISMLYSKFGDFNIEEKIETTENLFTYKIQFYHGETRKINFRDLEQAIAAFAVEIGVMSEQFEYRVIEDGEFLKTEWKTDSETLALSTIKKVVPFERNLYEDRQFIDGKELFYKIRQSDIIAED